MVHLAPKEKPKRGDLATRQLQCDDEAKQRNGYRNPLCLQQRFGVPQSIARALDVIESQLPVFEVNLVAAWGMPCVPFNCKRNEHTRISMSTEHT